MGYVSVLVSSAGVALEGPRRTTTLALFSSRSQMRRSETMSNGQGFGFNYDAAGVSAAPLPPSWTMMLIGIIALGFVAYRRQKKGFSDIAAA
jgi:hypothetical protein